MSSTAYVILAAGLGTRMRSGTAKVLHRLCGRPMIHYAVSLARGLGGRVVAVLGHQAADVTAAIERAFGAGAVQVALQTEQRGTGHAVAQALPHLAGAERVVILYGDVPLLAAETVRRLEAAYERSGVAALVTMRPADPGLYGRIVRDAAGRLVRIVEARDASAGELALGEVNAGIYCLRAGFLAEAIAGLRADNAQGELYLTDVAARAAETGEVATIEAPADEVTGVNDRADLAHCEAVLRARRNLELMRAGVTLRDPATTYVDADVAIERDVELGPGVHLRGRTRIAAGCRIDAGCVITDTAIAAGVTVKPYTVLTETEVGERAQVGPFSHARPGTVLGPDVHLGNFVECKKAHLGRGSKANHLTYLGDAEIGAGVNVGCGTITCNYDGKHKHKTVIEDGVFVGSDVQFVAPVTIGRGALIAAGTTVTRDVPAGALAIARTPQTNKEGWVEKYKP